MLSLSPSLSRCQLPPPPNQQQPIPATPAPPRPSAPDSPPSHVSNTLLLTELNDLSLFHPSFLAALKHHISTLTRLVSFSPLPSLSRIVLSFASDHDALYVRRIIQSGRPLELQGGFGQCNVFTPRVYFGLHTPLPRDLDDPSQDGYLKAPKATKQFLISPPPSPPAGWQVREEDPPNAETHAADLIEPLMTSSGLRRKEMPVNTEVSPLDLVASLEKVKDQREWEDSYRREHEGSDGYDDDDDEVEMETGDDGSQIVGGRSERVAHMSASKLVYDPLNHGGRTDLPLVCVEDTGSHGED